MRDSAQEFRELSRTYVSIHDVAKKDYKGQESADMAYGKLLDDRTELCNLPAGVQAGGSRRRFRKSRRVLTPFPHPHRKHRRTHRKH
jgi:hypothetical protein